MACFASSYYCALVTVLVCLYSILHCTLFIIQYYAMPTNIQRKVIIDYLLRSGAISPDSPKYLDVLRTLRSGTCI